MSHSFELMAWDLGNVLSIVDEGPPTRKLARMSGRAESEVFDAVFSPSRKVLFETGQIGWSEQFGFAAGRLGLKISIDEFTAIYNSALKPNTVIFPLVTEMLAQVRCAVASNTSESHWQMERSRLPFGIRLNPEVISCRVGAMKPDHRFFQAVSDLSSAPPEKIVFTDDREDNVAGAADLGITALYFEGHEKLRRDLRSLGFKV